MEAHEFLLQLLAILVAARVMGEIATLFGAPSVIGELVAGIIIGPSLLARIFHKDARNGPAVHVSSAELVY